MGKRNMFLPKLRRVRSSKTGVIDGKIKRYTISIDACGRYWLSLIVEKKTAFLPKTGKAVGIDVGLTHLAILSDGRKFDKFSSDYCEKQAEIWQSKSSKRRHLALVKSQQDANRKVLGHKTKDDDVLLTLCERKTRCFFMIKIEDKTSASVMKAFDKLREFYGSKWNRIFKSITTDNGSEFADLSNLEQVSKTLVYYAHPYTSCDKGSVERHNGLIRRYIPKGDRIDKYSVEDIAKIEVWCNSLPRKILNYKTPEECFDIELDHIYRHR